MTRGWPRCCWFFGIGNVGVALCVPWCLAAFMAVLFDCVYLGNSPFWLVLLITSQALFLVGVYTLLYRIVALPWYWSLYDWFVPSIVSRYYICTRPRLCFWLVLPIYTLSSPFVIRRRPRLCFWLVCSILKAFLSYCGFLFGPCYTKTSQALLLVGL
jgi:hypothetical protein